MAQTVTRRRRDGFKPGRSTHPCDVCGRITRETNAVSVGSKLCPQCWDLAGIENELQDGYRTPQDAQAQAEGLIAEVEAKGGDATSWRDCFWVHPFLAKVAALPSDGAATGALLAGVATRTQAIEAALRVIVLDARISDWLSQNDPQALIQARTALGLEPAHVTRCSCSECVSGKRGFRPIDGAFDRA